MPEKFHSFSGNRSIRATMPLLPQSAMCRQMTGRYQCSATASVTMMTTRRRSVVRNVPGPHWRSKRSARLKSSPSTRSRHERTSRKAPTWVNTSASSVKAPSQGSIDGLTSSTRSTEKRRSVPGCRIGSVRPAAAVARTVASTSSVMRWRDGENCRKGRMARASSSLSCSDPGPPRVTRRAGLPFVRPWELARWSSNSSAALGPAWSRGSARGSASRFSASAEDCRLGCRGRGRLEARGFGLVG